MIPKLSIRYQILVLSFLLLQLCCFSQPVDPSFFKGRKIVVKGDRYYPPYEFINKKGEPDGFNVELFRELAKELGIEFQIELGPWSKVWHDIIVGDADVLMGVMLSEQRAQVVNFGIPHSVMTHGIFTRSNDYYATINELKGKEVIVQNKDRMHEYLIEQKVTDKIILVQSQLEALQLLASGKHHAALLGNFQGTHLIREHNIKNIEVRSSSIEPQKYAMAVNKNNDELLWLLNMGLYQLKEKGTYDKLYQKWFSVYEHTNFYKKYKYIIVLFLAALLGLVVFILMLRFRVRKATQELKNIHLSTLELVKKLKAENKAKQEVEEALLRSERKFREIFNSTSEAIFIHEPFSGKIIDCNSKSVDLYGFETKEEILDRSISSLTKPIEGYNQIVAMANIKITMEKGEHTFEWPAMRKDGTLFWVEVSLKFAEIDGDIRVIAVVRDISDRKRNEEELIRAKNKAEESDRLKSAFLANLSHEIRTPLNSIMGFASLLPDEDAIETIRHYSSIIVRNSEQLVSIIDDIVLYSSLQTGIISCYPSNFNIEMLFIDVIESFNLPEILNGNVLLIDTSCNLKKSIDNDYDKLRRVLVNLVSNALKYCKNGIVTIGFTQEGKLLQFYVHDTGIGIQTKEQQLVFDRFYRASNVDKTTIGGTGLGLSIVKELVGLLGGTVWVESEIEKGSTFYFKIPC